MLGFKIFMLCMVLLIPAVMIGFGYYWKKHPPKRINLGYGYRTTRSIKSRQTWDFAHEVCARIWRIAGWWTLALSVIVFFHLWIEISDIGTLGTRCLVLVLLQIIPMILPLPITEYRLKREFHC